LGVSKGSGSVVEVVAITGATGFIGRALTLHLLDKGYKVVALARQPDRALEQAGASLIHGALEDRDSLNRLVAQARTVIHCAGAIKASSEAAFHEINGAGTARLAAAAHSAPRSDSGRLRFLLISSLAAREPGLSAYARSKRQGEDALAQEDGLERCVLRPPAVYGPGDRATLPLFRQMARGWLLTPWVPDGRFSLLYVQDLAAAVEHLLRQSSWDSSVLELDDGRQGGYDWPALAAIASRHLERRVRRLALPLGMLWLPAKVNRWLARAVGYAPVLTPGKLRELYHPDWVARGESSQLLAGWHAEVDFEAGLPQTLSWYREKGWI
jgi:nucleoside-diphosphate-sugar epimerase